VSNSDRRIVVAFLALSAWLFLLLAGRAFGGAIHALLVVALAVFPWRRLSQ
jgi:hypothetical protein